MPLSRTQLTNALLTLTPQQVSDLLLFEYFKKWTVDLFALAHAVNYSTAHRRLHKLSKAGTLMSKVGRTFGAGGSEPDVEFTSPDREDRVFVEVEQTSRADHILRKYEQYARFFSTLPEHPRPWLIVVFPDERTTKLLLPEHERAAYQVADGEDYLWFYATLTDLQAKNALLYESKVEPKPGGGLQTVTWGFLDCTRCLLDY